MKWMKTGGSAAAKEGPRPKWGKIEIPAADSRPEPPSRDKDTASEAQATGDRNSRLLITSKELIYLVGQLSIMFDTGLNLMSALECLALQSRSAGLRRLIYEIRSSIREGNALWAAMARHPRVFDPVCVNMVRSGEASGTMGQALARLENYLEREMDIRVRVRSALGYPAFMLALSVAVLFFLLSFVFPKFEAIFSGKEATLPWPTRFFLSLSHGITGYWYLLLSGLVLSGFLIFWSLKKEKIRERFDAVLLKIPLFGDLLIKMSLSRSFHTLGAMLSGGIPILDALGMAKDVAGNRVFQATWKTVAGEVEIGRELSGPIRANPLIPPSETQMIAMGESSGKLPEVLLKLSVRYEKEIDYSVKNLIRFIEPTLVLFMGFMVGMIVLSLILPIFALSRTGNM